jgi:hypothetical protein
LRTASLKLSVSPSPTPPEFPATATPTMSLETTGIVVGAAVVAGAVDCGGVEVVAIGGAVIAVGTGCVGGAVAAGPVDTVTATVVVTASCDVTSRVHAAGTSANSRIPNARRVLIATSSVDDRAMSRGPIFVVPPFPARLASFQAGERRGDEDLRQLCAS